MNSFHADRAILFFISCLFVHHVCGMNFLDRFFSTICGRQHALSQPSLSEQESKENQTESLLPVHNPHDVSRVLYDVLDTMPMDLITMIMQYDAYELKGICVLNHAVDGWVNCLMQVSDEVIIFGLHNGSFIIFLIKTGKILTTIQAHRKPIFEIGALLNGCLVSVSQDRTFKYWDIKKNWACIKQKNVITDDGATNVPILSMTRNAKDLIESNVFSGQIRLCDAKTGLLIGKITIPREATNARDCSNSDAMCITMFTPIIYKETMQSFEYIDGGIFDGDDPGKTIISGIESESKSTVSECVGRDLNGVSEIQLYDSDTKKPTGSIKIGSFRWLIKLAKNVWVSDNTADLHEIRLWNCKTGQCKTLLKMDQPIRAMAPLSNGMFAVGLRDTNIRIIDPKTKVTALILSHGTYIKGLELLNDGRLVSFGSGGVKLWS